MSLRPAAPRPTRASTAAETADKKATADLARLESLMARKEELSRAQYHAAVAAAETARASLASARAGIAEAENDATRAESEVAHGRGGLAGGGIGAGGLDRAVADCRDPRAGSRRRGADAPRRSRRPGGAEPGVHEHQGRRAGIVSRKSVEVGQIRSPGSR